MTLGKVIKQMRESLALSQEELASHLNIETGEIETWENDQVQPTHEQLQIMADLFNIEIKDLINGRIPNITPELLPIAEDKLFFKHACRFALLMAIAVSALFLGAAAYLFFNVDGFYSLQRTVLFAVLFFVAMATATVAGLRYSWFLFRHLVVVPTNAKQIRRFGLIFRLFILLALLILALSVFWIFAAKELLVLDDHIVIAGTFALIALASFLLVFFGVLNGEYYHRDPEKRPRNRWDLTGRVCSTTLILSTLAYLFVGLIFRVWHPTWIIFPLAGMFCGIYIAGLPEN